MDYQRPNYRTGQGGSDFYTDRNQDPNQCSRGCGQKSPVGYRRAANPYLNQEWDDPYYRRNQENYGHRPWQ